MIEDDKFRGIRILRLKRSERRMKRTSLSMLQSWRANCDVSVLIYDHDPASISCSDIANVSGYVVAYCTKGNMSFKTETEALKTLILATENDFIEGAKISTVTLARRILNTFHAKRVITKAEASCELLKLNLYECTENIVKVPLSSHTKIRKGKFKGIQSSALYKYATRKKQYANMNFHDFFYEMLTRNNDGAERRNVLSPFGLGGKPTYPVTYGYAKTSLILYKPWSKKKRLDFEQSDKAQDVVSEFKEFLSSLNCPIRCRTLYEIAKENGRRRLFAKDCSDGGIPGTSQHGISQRCEDLLQACRIYQDHPVLSSMDRGLSYDWSTLIHPGIDPALQARNWLTKIRDEYREKHASEKIVPKKQDGTKYKLDDIESDENQSTLVYTVLKTIREWVEWERTGGRNVR